MALTDKESETERELFHLHKKLIRNVPERLSSILDIAKMLEKTAMSDKSIARVLPAINELELALHSMIGNLGTLGLEWESQQARLLYEKVGKFKQKTTTPSSHDWENFHTTLKSLATSVQSINTERFAIKTIQAELRPGKGIWVVDDDPDQSELICTWLQHEGYQTRNFLTLNDFFNDLDLENKPDIILMDMRFKEGKFAGAKKIASLQVRYGHLPPIIFISVHDDLQARLLAFRAGATRYLVKPLKREYLLNLVAELSSEIPSSPYKVHLLDDDEQQLKLHKVYLELAGFDVSTSKEPLELVDDLTRFQPDALVLDVYMPDASGPELAAILKEMPEYKDLPILFLSAELDPSKHLLALGMGGDEYLVKPVQPNRLVACLRKHTRNARLRALSSIT